jgi:hypothetical protein
MTEAELAKMRGIAMEVLFAWVKSRGGRVAEAYEIIKPFILQQTKPGAPVQFSK